MRKEHAGRVGARWLIACALLAMMGACSKQEATEASTAATASAPQTAEAPRSGGEATVLLNSDFAGSWPAGLDPATNPTGAANISMVTAVFGGLFQMRSNDDGSGAKVVGVLASGYDLEDEGRTVVLHLRPGVKFSDGTPFNAEAVKLNTERMLSSTCTCSPRRFPWDKTKPVTTTDEHTVKFHFTRPYAALINELPISNMNFVASPTALKQLGEDKFRITPVGAGPFRVVSNQLSSRLVLERNPYYWEPQRPYLDRLTFQSIGGDQAAYQAILAGDAQAYEGMTMVPLVAEAQKNDSVTVTMQPAVSAFVVQLNTHVPPFNDQRAREAVYYASNSEAIRTGLFKNWFPMTQSFTAPGGLFHHDTVPGYRTYDLEKARAKVKELGGLHVKLTTLRTFMSEQVITALQSQWKEAGIDVEIATTDIGTLVKNLQSKEWQAMLQITGSFDPEAGGSLRLRFRSGSYASGVADTQLDSILDAAGEVTEPTKRDAAYANIARYLSDHAYAPFLFAQAQVQLARDLHGPGLTTRIPPPMVNTIIPWQDVWRTGK